MKKQVRQGALLIAAVAVAGMTSCEKMGGENSGGKAPAALISRGFSGAEMVLHCENIRGTTHTARVTQAQLYAGGTWIIFPAKDGSRAVQSAYQQSPGETCVIWTQDQACEALIEDYGRDLCAERAGSQEAH